MHGKSLKPASGKGPGLVLIPDAGMDATHLANFFAEECYIVLVHDPSHQDVQASISAVRKMDGSSGKVGIVGYGTGGKAALIAAAKTNADVVVSYYPTDLDKVLGDVGHSKCPVTIHVAGKESAAAAESVKKAHAAAKVYSYADAQPGFAQQGAAHFHKTSEILAHQRTIESLKAAIGPHFDLSALWDKHCETEFATRDVDATMTTMVSNPYVNHIPTMTGGVGYKDLYRFYKHHFVNSNPPDTALIPISRTVGANQVVDEMLFCFTHTCEVPWMLPGIAPTGKRVEVPLLAVVKFRGDKLCHEHIYWDQASVLVQIGVLDKGNLPIAGVEQGKKLLDESLPSNQLMAAWKTSEGK